jgi:SHS2 domain-containing protein
MSKPLARWEHFAHQSDIGVRGIGPTLGSAFEQAALALTAVVTDVSSVRTLEQATIECQAEDVEMLLIEWLDALIYRMAVGKQIFSRFDVQVDGTRLRARCAGEAIDVSRHQPAVEVKGATLCDLAVHETGGLWIAQCVVDV